MGVLSMFLVKIGNKSPENHSVDINEMVVDKCLTMILLILGYVVNFTYKYP